MGIAIVSLSNSMGTMTVQRICISKNIWGVALAGMLARARLVMWVMGATNAPSRVLRRILNLPTMTSCASIEGVEGAPYQC